MITTRGTYNQGQLEFFEAHCVFAPRDHLGMRPRRDPVTNQAFRHADRWQDLASSERLPTREQAYDDLARFYETELRVSRPGAVVERGEIETLTVSSSRLGIGRKRVISSGLRRSGARFLRLRRAVIRRTPRSEARDCERSRGSWEPGLEKQ